MVLAPGTLVGQYRVERRLAGGGMGEVYLARDTRLDRPVAIKFLYTPADAPGRRRLLREARAAAALDHPNICAVYEVGSDPAGGDYIAMQYIEGDTLAARLRRGRLRPDEALNLAGQITEALVAAHRRGIVHRDLKPHNIIVTPSGVVKLLDFGLATYAPDTPGAANAATTSPVTDPHAVVGTPGYMSPEQIRNEPADFRSDVFALGAVLYECLTGLRAFPGPSTAEILGKVLHVDPPPVSAAVPDVGPAYDAICARLLHKIPGQRFQSAEEVLGAIRALTPSSTFSASSMPMPPRRSRRAPMLWAGAAIAAAIVIAIEWPRTPALPTPTPDALARYEQGIEAMRDGTYATARALFTDATKLMPNYTQAYYRLAEAHIALDDDGSAKDALLQAAQLPPDLSKLSQENRLRFEAASSAARREREAAIKAYRQLADLTPTDAGRWIDLGRAQETGVHLLDAVAAYEKALSLDALSAAARLRLGVLQTRTGKTAEGLAAIDRALEEYRKQGKTEGEAEALLRKAVAQATNGKTEDARHLFNQVIQLAVESRYPAQRLGARFGLAKLEYVAGRPTEAGNLARQAVSEATAAGLPTLAAAGLLDIGASLIGRRAYDLADVELSNAIRIASERSATRVENRAKLWQASLRVQSDQPEQAVALGTGPTEYFEKGGETRLAIDGKLILARAYEALEQFDRAAPLTEEVLKFADSAGDDARRGGGLETKAGQLAKAGRLPEALVVREQIDALHRRTNEQSALAFDLTNHAELLILLGRGGDAEQLLHEVDQHIAKGEEFYVGRRQRVAVLRALMATTERRWPDVLRATALVTAASTTAASGSAVPALSEAEQFARVLSEHARAQMGRSGAAPETIASWPAQAPTRESRREFGFIVAQTLIARGAHALAVQVVNTALEDPTSRISQELNWRLSAAAAEAARRLGNVEGSATIGAQARASITDIKAAWADAATQYLARPDLAALSKSVR